MIAYTTLSHEKILHKFSHLFVNSTFMTQMYNACLWHPNVKYIPQCKSDCSSQIVFMHDLWRFCLQKLFHLTVHNCMKHGHLNLLSPSKLIISNKLKLCTIGVKACIFRQYINQRALVYTFDWKWHMLSAYTSLYIDQWNLVLLFYCKMSKSEYFRQFW